MRANRRNSLRQFAKRHHLVVDMNPDNEYSYPPESIFRHKNSRDEAVAYGIVHSIDIRLAQHRLPESADGRQLLATILSTPSLHTEGNQALFLHRSLSAAHALSIKHLRGNWSHSHERDGHFFTPLAETLNQRVHASIVNDSVSVELTPTSLLVAAYPALENDEAIEVLLGKLLKILEAIEQSDR